MRQQNNFADAGELANALGLAVAGNLNTSLAESGRASLAVSGGSTPTLFFKALGARKDVDWSKVTVTLVDERWVDEKSHRSNARLVRDKLLQGPASAARFVPLYSGGKMPDEEKIAETNKVLGALPMPLSAAIFGMGEDGHTASFFPGGDTLEAALNETGPALAISAPGAGEPRVTLTLPFLLGAKNLYLHVQGNQKALVLEKALAGDDIAEMPVRALLHQDLKPVEIYWCP
ncbi:MAG TPA: 6-phosphogluconolactonase [Devosia sp.]|nr:6-phosphogluconolactonase [Devosia sp.]